MCQAPSDGRLTAEMLADYQAAGVLILEDFVSRERCDELRAHALEMIDAFDPEEVRHVFTAADDLEHGDAHLGDAYFRAGRTDQAVATWQRAVEAFGDAPQYVDAAQATADKIAEGLAHNVAP